MSEYKYPYIPRDYYAAVMFAVKMIRDNGYFNVAIKKAASYYNVDPDTLEKHVRARQGAGQAGKKRGTYHQYHYKGTAELYYGECDSYFGTMKFDEILKATSPENAWKQLYKKLLRGYDSNMASMIFQYEVKGDLVNGGTP